MADSVVGADELCELVASVLDLQRYVVDGVAEALRAAGLFPKPHLADVSIEIAVDLLIAVAGASRESEAVEALNGLTPLPVHSVFDIQRADAFWHSAIRPPSGASVLPPGLDAPDMEVLAPAVRFLVASLASGSIAPGFVSQLTFCRNLAAPMVGLEFAPVGSQPIRTETALYAHRSEHGYRLMVWAHVPGFILDRLAELFRGDVVAGDNPELMPPRRLDFERRH